MRFYLSFILIFITTLLYSQVFIDKIEYPGVKYIKQRLENDCPLKPGGVWNNYEKSRLLQFFDILKAERILEDTPVSIEEKYIPNNRVIIKVNLNENIPFFIFPLPFWSTSNLLKLKLRFWVFHFNGYLAPVEGYLEFIERDALNSELKITNLALNKEKNLSMTLNIFAYTSLLNYVIKYQSDDTVFKKYKTGDTLNAKSEWKNGIDNFFLAFKYTDPETQTIFYPSFGLNLKNILKTDITGDIASAINYNDSKFMINPKFDFSMPVRNTNIRINSRVGFVYRNDYILNKDRETNAYLFGIGNINSDSMDDYPDITGNDYLSYIGVTGVRIPFINCYLSSVVCFTFKSLFTVLTSEETSGYIYKSTIDNVNYYVTNTFKLKPVLNLHFPLNMIKADIYINFGLNYMVNNFVFTMDNKEYTKNSIGISQNYDDTFKYPAEAKIVFNLNKINAFFTNIFGLAFNSDWYNSYDDITTVFKAYDTTNNTRFNFDNTVKFKNISDFTVSLLYLDATLVTKIEIDYWRKWRTLDNVINQNYKDTITDGLYINEISVLLSKRIPFSQSYLVKVKADNEMNRKVLNYNNVAVKFNFCFPEDDYKALYFVKNGEGKLNPGNFVFQFDLAYNLYLPIYSEHVYKMRLWVFGRVNQTKVYTSAGESYYNDPNYLDYWFRVDRTSKIGYFGGFAGILMNLEYKMPLFVIDTAKFFNYSFGKEFIWKVYWHFYIDCGLAVNSSSYTKDGNRYTYDGLNNLHLVPAMTIGTAFKVYPRFVPVVATLEISYNIDGKLLINKNDFASYLFIGFSFSRIDESSGNNWFKE